MSNDATFTMNPFLAPWLRATRTAGGWPAEMMRQQMALLTEWNRQSVALMTAAWARPSAPSGALAAPTPALAPFVAPVPAPAPAAPAVRDAVATLPEAAPVEAAPVEAAPEPTVIEAVAEPVAAPAPKPARKPKAAQLRAAPQRRKAAEKVPAKKGTRATRH